jgi:hypothetical protein
MSKLKDVIDELVTANRILANEGPLEINRHEHRLPDRARSDHRPVPAHPQEPNGIVLGE